MLVTSLLQVWRKQLVREVTQKWALAECKEVAQLQALVGRDERSPEIAPALQSRLRRRLFALTLKWSRIACRYCI